MGKISRFFKRSIRIDPMINKMVIHFTTHGCMAQQHEFDFIGKIDGVEYRDEHKFYRVKVLRFDSEDKEKFTLAPSWYLSKVVDDLYIYFD